MQKIFFLFVLLFVSPLIASAQTSCLAYPSASTPPSGYGTSWGVFSPTRPMLVFSDCPASGNEITITIGKGGVDQYVWGTTYVHNGTDWTPHTLNGSPSEASGWLRSQGTVSVTVPPTTSTQRPLFFVGYVCSQISSQWKCGCADASCSKRFWQLQAYTGLSTGSAGSGDSWSTTPLPPLTGTWSVVAREQRGWLTEARLPNGDNNAGVRFSFASPDGSTAVREIIRVGDIVGPPGWDSPEFTVDTNGKGYMLRYQMWMEGYYGKSGKFFSLMGGRGLAGGAYVRNDIEKYGNDGWGHVTMHPEIEDNTRNIIKGYLYSYNRMQTGGGGVVGKDGDVHGDDYGSDRTPIPQGRWLTIDIVNIMNTNGNTNGEGRIYVDGRMIARKTGVMWYGPNRTWKTIWMRWRNMYGGDPIDMPAHQAATTYYKNFEIWINK